MPKSRNWLMMGVGAVAASGGMLTAGMAASAQFLLRRRAPDPSDPPTHYGISYQDATFTSRDGLTLRGWWIPVKGGAAQARGTILMCHGQDGSMDGDTRQMPALHDAGYNVLMFNFRAHGTSDGELVTMGILEVEDVLGALDHVVNTHGVEKVGILGLSMGGAAALMAAERTERIVTIVADSCYVTLEGALKRFITQRGVPMFLSNMVVMGALSVAGFRSNAPLYLAAPNSVISQLGKRPLLFIYGAHDPYVDMDEVRAMVGAAQGPAEVWIVDGVRHRGAFDSNPEAYNQRVVEWFNRHLT